MAFEGYFHFIPVFSGRKWKKLEETSIFHLFPAVLEKTVSSWKKPNPDFDRFIFMQPAAARQLLEALRASHVRVQPEGPP